MKMILALFLLAGFSVAQAQVTCSEKERHARFQNHQQVGPFSTFIFATLMTELGGNCSAKSQQRIDDFLKDAACVGAMYKDGAIESTMTNSYVQEQREKLKSVISKTIEIDSRGYRTSMVGGYHCDRIYTQLLRELDVITFVYVMRK